jgi:cytochrome c oxidase subunit 2
MRPILDLLRRRAGVPLLAAALLSGCAPSAATVQGSDVAWLYWLFMAAAAVVFVVVAGLLGWSVVRYRAAPGNDRPADFDTNVRLELVWWALPTLLVIGLFAVSAKVLGDVDRHGDASALQVQVEGFQWQWKFTYPQQDVTVIGQQGEAPEIVLPVGRPITFELTSPDVQHSFYVPQFLFKRDAIPGITNRVTLTIDRAGTYGGQCAEFCGLLHSAMQFTIRAVPQAEFDTWLQQQGSGS